MKFYLALVALGTACLSAQSGPVTPIADVTARSITNLNGKWKAIVDPSLYERESTEREQAVTNIFLTPAASSN